MTNNLKPIGLIADEACDLPKEIIEKYQIAIVPVKMDWPDLENMPGENTFQKMREVEKRGIKTFGKTSQPAPGDFLKSFKKQLEEFEKIICITITSKHSGTYNSALQAKNFLNPEEKERVFVVDSLNVSGGTGLLVLKAIDLIKKEKKYLEEILKELEKFIPKIHLYAFLKDPKWAEASGRISSFLANWMRRMAKIGFRPILGVKKGKVVPVGIKTGAKDIPNALLSELEIKTKKLREQGKKIRVAIVHGDNLEGAQRLKEMIEEKLKEIEITFVNLIDNVLGILTGPDALVLVWAPIE